MNPPRWISGKNGFDDLFSGEVPGAMQVWRAGVRNLRMLTQNLNEYGEYGFNT